METKANYEWIWQGGYNKIPHLEDIEEIMECQRVVVMEKIHGLCWLVGCRPGEQEILYADRWQIHNAASPLGHIVDWFDRQTSWVASIHQLTEQVHTPVVVMGEVFGNKIYGDAATDSYGTLIPYLDYGCEMDFRIHDLRLQGRQVDWCKLENLVQSVNLPLAPVFYTGRPDLSIFEALLGKAELVKNSRQGEGIIIRSDPLAVNNCGQVLIGKMKVGEYAEVNSQTNQPIPVPVRASPTEKLAIEYATQQRVAKGVARLIAAGTYHLTREVLFPLTDIVVEDIRSEAAKAWTETLAVEPEGEAALHREIQRIVKYWLEQALRQKLIDSVKTER